MNNSSDAYPPRRVRSRRSQESLPGDVVQTVPEAGWSGIKNGKLCALIAGRFDVFMTIDQNTRHQQNLAGLAFAILFVSVTNNMMDSYRPLLELIRETAHKMQPGEVKIIS